MTGLREQGVSQHNQYFTAISTRYSALQLRSLDDATTIIIAEGLQKIKARKFALVPTIDETGDHHNLAKLRVMPSAPVCCTRELFYCHQVIAVVV